ncbi:hypothetical protein CQ10_11550 [Bradyrhizobium valentinum]|uniref:Uncharacterized protein n=1 Tax=Bradyrhizobium valentinum TaxID=1518501 RepID=A0A0R3KQZ8_9BRAD|nr:hypothetical protein CP49_28255 [Bradyrhizobium valentinum]KRR11049.1 hypothetical protein CQ10_11550 [Bradyrhizobium valentinum]
MMFLGIGSSVIVVMGFLIMDLSSYVLATAALGAHDEDGRFAKISSAQPAQLEIGFFDLI